MDPKSADKTDKTHASTELALCKGLNLMHLIMLVGATIKAYADCNRGDDDEGLATDAAMADRDLQFKGAIVVPRGCAIEIMRQALSRDGSYNNFTPNLLKEFPDDALFRLGRDNSVCIWVLAGKEPLPTAEEVKADERGGAGGVIAGEVRYWWD